MITRANALAESINGISFNQSRSYCTAIHGTKYLTADRIHNFKDQWEAFATSHRAFEVRKNSIFHKKD
ncbi:hypothetical protein [Edaphovirga cremea]|uniref:hypothetical protein n=1 Tax=Edaphovirga cremea TaxID=2267246 RepID=UPI000DEF12E6|nr:hypothetical protein [Edaphovirga cremea]